MLPLLSTPCPKTTPLARKAMDALIGQTFTVTKGCKRKGISARERGTVRQVAHIEDSGFSIHFEIKGRIFVMWATSPARFLGDTISLNTGDPTICVKMLKTKAAS